MSGVLDALQRHDAPKASIYDLELAHSRMHVAAMRGLDLLMQVKASPPFAFPR